MDSPNKQELFDYYDARAPEYEEFYDGVTSRRLFDPALIRKEIAILKKLLSDHVSGRCIDVACGTGFWLPVYEANCARIMLIDQSEKSLYECNKKISELGIGHKTEIICSDIFSYPFTEQVYDSAVIAFLISHLTDDEIDALMTNLKTLLVPGSKFIIMDKAWNEIIAAIPRSKAGMVKRILKDDRQFEILNRYFEKYDLEDMARRHDFNLDIVYWGKVFLFAAGSFFSEASA